MSAFAERAGPAAAAVLAKKVVSVVPITAARATAGRNRLSEKNINPSI
jgi:hypothetical protein